VEICQCVEHNKQALKTIASKSQAVVVLYIHKNEKLTGPHVGLGLDIAGVEILSSGVESTDWSFQVSVILRSA